MPETKISKEVLARARCYSVFVSGSDAQEVMQDLVNKFGRSPVVKVLGVVDREATLIMTGCNEVIRYIHEQIERSKHD